MKNIKTSSIDLLQDDGGHSMLLLEAFRSPEGELVVLDDAGMSIQSPQRDSQIPALPLPPKIRALYQSVKNHPIEEFISQLIDKTQDNKSLLDQIRNDLYKIQDSQKVLFLKDR